MYCIDVNAYSVLIFFTGVLPLFRILHLIAWYFRDNGNVHKING